MTEPVPVFRRAIVDDTTALAELAEKTFRDTFAAQNSEWDLNEYCSKNFGSQIQLSEIENANTVTILAQVDGVLAGYSQLRLQSPKECVPSDSTAELCRFYISQEFHGRGLAQALIHEVFDVASQSSVQSIWLGVWEHNLRAIAFYKKYGFEMVGEHTFLFGNDPQRDLIMAFSLRMVDAKEV